jgi:predicted PurR-regulated permease PerM
VERRYEISLRTILLTFGVLVSVWIFFQLRTLIASLFVALILTLALDPIITRIKNKGISRSLVVAAVFVAVLLSFGGIVAYGVAPMFNQLGRFLIRLPLFLDPIISRLGPDFLAEQIRNQLFSQLADFSTKLFNSTVIVASNSFAILVTFFFTFYLLIDWDNIRSRFTSLFNRPTRKQVDKMIVEMEQRLGGWVRGMLILMLIVGGLTFVGLFVLGVDYALPLALIAAVMEIIPIVGPILAAIPAAVVGFSESMWMGVGVILLYIVVQQLENYFIVPGVMNKAVGFSPLITLIILFVGGELFGFVGILFGIPVAIFGAVIARNLLNPEGT